jgi:anthranilate phosphoribosyltransferase
MIVDAIAKLVERKPLAREEARAAVGEILGGAATPSQIAGFLTALRMKGETTEEIAGCAEAMRAAATRVDAGTPVVVDTCGTGGDKQGCFNVSTASAFVAAGAGYTVAKHGNRSISSKCGSADVLEELGVKIDAPALTVERCLKEIGIAFLFAPAFHPAMKHAMPTRRELAMRTVFNILGPLCNPAGANAQVIGVYSPDLIDVVGKVLVSLGTKYSMVVHSLGHDEITLSGVTQVGEIVSGKYKRRVWRPADFGLPRQPKEELSGGDKRANADTVRRILQGEKGPRRDVVVANAAAAIFVASRAAGDGKARNLKEARLAAERSIESGKAIEKLNRLIAGSNS